MPIASASFPSKVADPMPHRQSESVSADMSASISPHNKARMDTKVEPKLTTLINVTSQLLDKDESNSHLPTPPPTVKSEVQASPSVDDSVLADSEHEEDDVDQGDDAASESSMPALTGGSNSLATGVTPTSSSGLAHGTFQYTANRRVRRRPRRATMELEPYERWQCPKGCGKIYRKNSTVSIRKHVPYCQGPALPNTNGTTYYVQAPPMSHMAVDYLPYAPSLPLAQSVHMHAPSSIHQPPAQIHHTPTHHPSTQMPPYHSMCHPNSSPSHDTRTLTHHSSSSLANQSGVPFLTHSSIYPTTPALMQSPNTPTAHSMYPPQQLSMKTTHMTNMHAHHHYPHSSPVPLPMHPSTAERLSPHQYHYSEVTNAPNQRVIQTSIYMQHQRAEPHTISTTAPPPQLHAHSLPHSHSYPSANIPVGIHSPSLHTRSLPPTSTYSGHGHSHGHGHGHYTPSMSLNTAPPNSYHQLPPSMGPISLPVVPIKTLSPKPFNHVYPITDTSVSLPLAQPISSNPSPPPTLINTSAFTTIKRFPYIHPQTDSRSS